MKKRLLASLLAAAMTLTMAPAAFAAEGGTAELSNNPTSSITTTKEDPNTLQYKINHDTTGKVIVLDQNYKESITLTEGKHSIDLNGYTITNEDGKDTITISNGASLAIEGNGTVDNVSHGKAAIWNKGTCTLNGGMFTGGIYTINNDCAANLTINDGTFTNDTQAVFQNHGTATVTGGTFVGTLNIYGLNSDVSTVNISGGNFKGGIQKNNGEISISGGHFNFDPSDYLAKSTENGKKYVATVTKGEYTYKVELVDKSVVPAVLTTGTNTAPNKEELEKNTDIDKASVEAVANAAKEVAVDSKEISEQAQNAAANLSDDQKKTFKDAAKGDVPNVEKIEVRSHIDVVPKAFNKEKYTLDITPKIDIVVVGKNGSADASKVVATQELTIKKSTIVNIPLPTGFVTSTANLFVQHKGYEYEATVKNENNAFIATFENPHGFSEFTITKNSQTAAKINNVCYTKFEDAVTAAENNETVYVIGSDTEYKATISGASKTIKVENGKDKDITVTINNTVKIIKPQKTAEFTYTKPSSGGSSSGGSSSGGSSSGGSSSKTTYKVTTSSVANGGVNVSPSSPAKGDKVKITLSPNKGYKLDKLTVTDASGKTVSTTKTSDTVYTFTMPASQVTVGVTYVKADETTEQPSTKTFSDVSSSDWFADAVKYVSDKGMMNGTGNGKFSPADSTTRAMLMTVIARYAGADTTGSNPWYQKGMEWAKANGVSDGTAPNANITREQLVTMMYRYAKASGKDVSVGKDTNILSYADATTVSEYAVPAMQWACGAGIVNGANGKLNPQNNATRAEVAAILMRFCENVK